MPNPGTTQVAGKGTTTTRDTRTRFQKFTPNLWFDDQAEEAAEFYTSVFKNSRITQVTRYGEAGAKASGRPKGSVMTVTFQLDGQDFVALNGGPVFKLTEAISVVCYCEDQREIDEYWRKLTSDGGEESVCGWLKDKFGLSWQVVPRQMGEWMEDPKRADRVMAALLPMKKLDVKKLQDAANKR